MLSKNLLRFFFACLVIQLWGFPSLVLAADQVLFYHTDPVGTPLAVTDSNGAVVWQADYKPFGEENSITGSATNNKRFVGKEKDSETGLDYFSARYMNDKIGRFVSVDPVGAVDPKSSKTNENLLLDPQRFNLYAYGMNNPYRYVDADGLEPGKIFEAPKKAAKDALGFINKKSIKENTEYGGEICKKGKDKYFATPPISGNGDTVKPHDSPCPTGCKTVGDYHTHGDYSIADPNGLPIRSKKAFDQFDSDNFSGLDKVGISGDAAIYGSGYKGYLGTPGKKYKVYNPASGKVGKLK